MALILRKPDIKNHLPEYLISRKEISKLRSIQREDLGYGFDKFGMDISSVIFYYSIFKQLYNGYFEVRSYGHENIPKTGPVVLIANNAGTVAYDGAILLADLLSQLTPPRLARTIIDRSAAQVPYVNVLLQRLGQVIGTRRNFEELIKQGEVILNFPESRRGFQKRWSKRHNVQKLNVGFLELAYKNKVPIIPAAIITKESPSRALRTARLALRPFALPGFPPLLLPLPTQYTIYYGEPVLLHTIIDGFIVSQPEILDEVVDELRQMLQAQINVGLVAEGMRPTD